MLPIIDLARFRDGDAADRATVVRELANVCANVGFFYVRNHGLDDALVDEAECQMRAFFALPDDIKLKCKRRPGQYRGYLPVSPFSTDAAGKPAVFYEAFFIGDDIAWDSEAVRVSSGLITPNRWPNEPAAFADVFRRYFAGASAISESLLRAFSLALGGGEDAFGRMFNAAMSNISLLHYTPGEAADEDLRESAAAHYDTNALTILKPGKVGGLQVDMSGYGSGEERWRDVEPLDGCFVVNLGNMMETWSGGAFRSTMHRVNPPAGVERYSMAYFATPAFDTYVEPLGTVGEDRSGRHAKPMHAGEAFRGFVAQFDDPAGPYTDL